MTALMSHEVFAQFRSMIYAKTGLDFSPEKKYLLESRLQPRLVAVNCRTFEEYFTYLRFDLSREREMTEVFNCITTNETFFFRDAMQIDCFRYLILPHLIKVQERTKKIRIWSAGCSSGEEPFTLAMIIKEEFPSLSSWDVEILATDLSERVLNMAREGIYGAYSVRNVPETYLRKYFDVEDGRYTIGPALKSMVTFSHLNLADSLKMRTIRGIDVIFCRNVLIYFDLESRKKIMANFYDNLGEGGILVIGFSESLHGINRLFHPAPWNKTMVYRKAATSLSASVLPSHGGSRDAGKTSDGGGEVSLVKPVAHA